MNKYLKEADPGIKEWFKDHKEYPFQLYCDRRQLPFCQRFSEEYFVQWRRGDVKQWLGVH
jgi:hypothetical protein